MDLVSVLAGGHPPTFRSSPSRPTAVDGVSIQVEGERAELQTRAATGAKPHRMDAVGPARLPASGLLRRGYYRRPNHNGSDAQLSGAGLSAGAGGRLV